MPDTSHLKTIIEETFNSKQIEKAKTDIEKAIHLLDQGQIRVCEKKEDTWQVNEWVKKTILLYFQLKKSKVFSLETTFPILTKSP